MDSGLQATTVAAPSLPAEILLAILKFYREQPSVNADPWEFLALTLVCRAWRYAVFADKHLWTNIVLPAPLPVVLRALVLSDDCPLDFTFNDDCLYMHEFAVEAVLKALSRARRIVINATEMVESPAGASTVTDASAAPAYEANPMSQYIIRAAWSASNLESLDVVSYPGIWTDLTGLSTAKMKSLTVRPSATAADNVITADDFAVILACMPQLEELDIVCPASVTPLAAQRIPTPPSLHRIGLAGGSIFDTVMVLCRLYSHKVTQISLENSDIRAGPLSDDMVAGALRGALPILVAGTPLDSIELDFAGSPDKVVLRAYTREHGLRFASAHPMLDDELHEFVAQLPLENVRTLVVMNAGEDMDRAPVRALRTLLENVEELVIGHGTPGWIENVLVDAPTELRITKTSEN